MAHARAPVVIAYDGSELSRAAVRHAAELFQGRPTVLATVWEPALTMMAGASDPGGVMPLGLAGEVGGGEVNPDTIELVDRSQLEHALQVAEAGAELARSLQLEAEAHAMPDSKNIADTLIDLARERGAVAIVAGSHGRSELRSLMLGSVSHKLVAHCDRPVVVIRGERP